MRSYPDDTLLVQIFCGVLADVRNVGCQFLHSALCLAHLGEIFINMDRSEDVPFHHLFREHYGVLVVVTFPRHESDLEVASEGELAVLCGIAFRQNLAAHDLVALADDRLEGHGSALVCPSINRKGIYSLVRSE